MAFVKAERTQLWLRCALFGPSGSGKTMTALRIAKGIADRMGTGIAVIDTEARSASKYADRFKFQVDNLKNRTIDGYLASMRECIDAGYQVLVIDSLSHAWHELLQEVDQLAYSKYNGNTNAAWSVGTPKQKRLIEAIITFPAHLIVTMRSKTEWVMDKDEKGKTKPVNMGLAPEQGKGVEYEFDLLIRLDQKHQATVTKDRTGKFQDEIIDKPGEKFGIALYEWLSGGDVVLPPPQTAPVTVEKTPPATTTAPSTPEPARPKPVNRRGDAVNPPPSDQEKAKLAALRADMERVIREIGEIVNSVNQTGDPYFSDTEKAEAHEIVVALKVSETGLKDLLELQAILADNLTKKRQPQTIISQVA